LETVYSDKFEIVAPNLYYDWLIYLFIYCISQTWQHIVKFSVNTGYIII